MVSSLCACPCHKAAFRSEGSASTKCVGDSVVLSDVVALCLHRSAVARRVPPLWVLKALVTGVRDNWGRCSDPSSKVSRQVGEILDDWGGLG